MHWSIWNVAGMIRFNRVQWHLLISDKINDFIFSASEAFDGTYPTNVVVTSSGSCTYIPPGIFMSTCKIDITWFPFDDQNCEMKFGSWTYNGFKVNMFCGLNQLGSNQKDFFHAARIFFYQRDLVFTKSLFQTKVWLQYVTLRQKSILNKQTKSDSILKTFFILVFGSCTDNWIKCEGICDLEPSSGNMLSDRTGLTTHTQPFLFCCQCCECWQHFPVFNLDLLKRSFTWRLFYQFNLFSKYFSSN